MWHILDLCIVILAWYKVKGLLAVSSIDRNVSKGQLQGVRQHAAWIIEIIFKFNPKMSHMSKFDILDDCNFGTPYLLYSKSVL